MAMRLPFAVIAALLVLLVPLGFATDSPEEPEAAAPVELTPVAEIAGRVQSLRGLEFETRPVPETVTKEQATREGLADLDRAYSPEERRADELLYTTLGLLPEGTDLREESASIFGDQVAGYYDPRTERLRLVEGVSGTRVGQEMIIAHELVHALEDQAAGLDLDAIQRSDDPAYAYHALVEGTATEVMFAYVGEYFEAEEGIAGLLSDGLNAPSTASLPPFLVQQLTFPYLSGQLFVNELYRTAGSWRLVDLALDERPPTTTEQILHPRKWLAAEGAVEVELPAPPRGYEELTSGVFGEWQTGELLKLSGQVQSEAAQGWGGDAYALYEADDGPALVMRWVHDSARDGTEFAEALDAYAEEELDEAPGWAIEAGAEGVTLVIAPTPEMAERLSRA